MFCPAWFAKYAGISEVTTPVVRVTIDGTLVVMGVDELLEASVVGVGATTTIPPGGAGFSACGTTVFSAGFISFADGVFESGGLGTESDTLLSLLLIVGGTTFESGAERSLRGMEPLRWVSSSTDPITEVDIESAPLMSVLASIPERLGSIIIFGRIMEDPFPSAVGADVTGPGIEVDVTEVVGLWCFSAAGATCKWPLEVIELEFELEVEPLCLWFAPPGMVVFTTGLCALYGGGGC